MESFLKGFSRKRIISSITLFILVVTIFILICSLTSQNTTESNTKSSEIAQVIERCIERYFPVNHNDLFWGKTLNLILRKAAHFVEYMMFGVAFCAFLNVLLFKLGQSAKISVMFCPIVAVIDEFRQNFVSGRSPRLFDVGVDVCGALLGILLVTAVFAVIWKIRILNKRIEILETKDM